MRKSPCYVDPEMGDVVDKLEAFPGECDCTLGALAVAEIERLRAERDKLVSIIDRLPKDDVEKCACEGCEAAREAWTFLASLEDKP